MKKVKAGCKRFLCSLLLTVLLSNTVFHSYFGAVNCQAATAPALLYTSLMEVVMLSLGLSYSSTADLTAGGAALKSMCESMADAYEFATDKTSPKWWGYQVAKQLAVSNAYGVSISLSEDEYIAMGNYVKSIVSSQIVDFESYSILPVGFDFFYVDDVNSSSISSFIKKFYPAFDESYLTSPDILNFLDSAEFVFFIPGSSLLYYGNDNAVLVYDSYGELNTCNASCSSGYACLGLASGYTEIRESEEKNFLYSNVSMGYNSLASDDSAYFLIKKNTYVFSSFEEYMNYYNSLSYAPSSTVYGSASASKELTTDEDGNVSMVLDEAYFTAQVEQAVANALAENAEATDEELNAVVVDLMATTGEIQDSIGDLEDAAQTEIGLLTSILSALTLLGTSMDELVNAISVSGDGTAILDWDEIDDAFAETEVTTGGSESDNDDDDNKPKPWVPGAIVTTGLLAPVISHFSEPLSIITQYLDSIGEWIMDIPESIADALSTFDNPLDVLIEGVSTLGDDIFAGLPDIDIPSISNPLDRILEVLESMFVIDAGLIMDAIGENSLVWENKFSFLSRLSTIFNESVTPDYDYPVIKVQTPDILKFYYSEEYIILCDFKDFEVQCLWVRNLTRAFVWVAFALSVFKQFRVYFHVG